MFFAWLISRAAIGFKGVGGRLLTFRPLLYFGKISYGLYVYHMFALWMITVILMHPFTLRLLDLTVFQAQEVSRSFLVRLVATLAVAMVSWHLYECPINNLKRFFPYSKRKPEIGTKAPTTSGKIHAVTPPVSSGQD